MDSVTALLNSGSSSRKRTPPEARDISPGIGIAPPPTSAGADIVWCGERNGLTVTSPDSESSVPDAECIFVTSTDSSKLIRGIIVGRRFASIDFPVPGGPTISIL